jgi:hypothetical protein
MIRLVACLLLEQVSLSFFLMSLLQYSTSSCCSSSMFVHGYIATLYNIYAPNGGI